MGGTTVAKLLEFGADVYALDMKEVTLPVKKYIRIDLGKKGDIEDAARQLPARIDCLFNCAGLPGVPFSPFDVAVVNFLAARHLTELLLPRMESGGAIAIIASHAGILWQRRLDLIKGLLQIADWEKACDWLKAHADVNDGYRFSKKCLVVYAKWRAPELAKKNIRINCLCPGVTTTPMYGEYWEKRLTENEEHWRDQQGPSGRNATPEEMAWPLLFLNSDLASYISGVDLYVDYGRDGEREVGLKERHSTDT